MNKNFHKNPKFVTFITLILICLLQSFAINSLDNSLFCTQTKDFISVLNLGNDLVFQTTNKTFLKLKDCIEKDFSTMNDPYKRVELDQHLTSVLDNIFDLSAPIYGFTFQFMSRECGSLDVLSECTEIYDDSSTFYACVYGKDLKNQSLKYFAKKYNNSRLEDIKTIRLESRVRTYCAKKHKHDDNILSKEGFFSSVSFRLPHPIQTLSNISIYEDKVTYQIYSTESLSRPNTINLLSYQFCRLYDTNLTDNWAFAYEYYIPKSKLFHIFRYQNITFGCPQNCNLRSNLSLIKIGPNLTVWDLEDVFNTNQSLRTLMGCQLFKEKPFEPNVFCSQPKMQNIMTLGRDLYFQNNAMFWKYSNLSFTSEGNRNYKSNIGSIRFDSDMSSLLMSHNIDITQNVFGFTFKYDSTHLCGDKKVAFHPKSLECFQLFQSNYYYRSCIYGEVFSKDSKLSDTKTDWNYKAFAFQYTPSGLKRFSNSKIGDETQKYCETVLNKLTEHVLKTVKTFKILSIAGSMYNRLRNKYEIYFTIKLVDNSNKIQVLMLDLIPDQPLDTQMKFWDWTTDYPSEIGLFFFNRTESSFQSNLFVYDTQRRLEDKLLYYAPPSGQTIEIKDHSQSLSTLFNCPFNQSYSLVSELKESVCDSNGKSVPKSFKSIFNIGKSVYFQSGRHFYRYNYITAQISYNKYITDLINDWFDTRYRVTGYSYLPEMNASNYRVVLVGRSKPSEGSEFKNNSLYAIFDIVNEDFTFEPLVPLNDRKSLKGITRTFGSFADEYLELGLTSDKILAIVYFQTREQTADFKGKLVVIYDDNKYPLLNVSSIDSQLEFPANSEIIESVWKGFDSDYKRSEFKDILGMFLLSDYLYLVAKSSTDTSDQLKIFQISLLTDLSKTILSNRSFAEFFVCYGSKGSGSGAKGSESSYSTTGFSITFILLLLLLVCLALFTAYMAYKRFGPKDENQRQKKPGPIKVLDKDPDNHMIIKEDSNTESKESLRQKSETESVRSDVL